MPPNNAVKQYDGSYHMIPPSHEAYIERSLEAVIDTSCLCGATFHGTARDGAAWHREHRAVMHPEWRDRGQSVRRAAAKAAPLMLGSQVAWGEM